MTQPRADTVRCLGCETRTPRAEMQQSLRARNPAWAALEARAAPDGDADVEDQDFASFDVPTCSICGGMLKPDVVFFGESVPRERVQAAYAALSEARLDNEQARHVETPDSAVVLGAR